MLDSTMDVDGAISCLIEEADGSHSAAYGPFMLRSAFQPIYSQGSRGQLHIEGYEALIRPLKGGEPVSPEQFFSLVEPGDGPAVERLCRRLHLKNAAASDIGAALVFLNIDPACFTAYVDLVREAGGLAGLAREAGLSPTQIVCEITEKETAAPQLLRTLAEALREHRFKIAVDDYGAEESDSGRVEMLEPDIVKFDALWVHRFMETSEGFGLLRTMVRLFRDNGVLTLFEGLEEHWQVAACRELGVRLLQGYALAHPKLAPVGAPSFGDAVSRAALAGEGENGFAPPVANDAPAATKPARAPAARRAVFGRRGR